MDSGANSQHLTGVQLREFHCAVSFCTHVKCFFGWEVPENGIPSNEQKLQLINAVKFGRFSNLFNQFKSIDYPHPCVYRKARAVPDEGDYLPTRRVFVADDDDDVSLFSYPDPYLSLGSDDEE